MIYFTDEQIDRYIKEDLPSIDLTTTLMGIGKVKGMLEFRVREAGVAACTEEAARVMKKLGITVLECLPSGTAVGTGDMILAGTGDAQKLHMAWKVCLNILEYCCGIATNAKNLVDKATQVNPDLGIVVTRKFFPGTKELVIKSAMAGGALPHRLGLSETVLIFKQHKIFLGNTEALVKKIPKMKKKASEKKVIVEVESLEEALKLASAGADGIQFDKVPPEELKEWVKTIRNLGLPITLIAAGGINVKNIEHYAGTGVDAIATSALFHGKPMDISAKMSLHS